MPDSSAIGRNLLWRSGVVIAVSMNLLANFATSANAATEKVLHSFCTQQNCADGKYPYGRLINVKGTQYGTTAEGGANGDGTVFSITPGGNEKVVYSFGATPDGEKPQAGLINANGTLYGTTVSGGADQVDGTVFSVDPTTGTERVLHSFGPSGTDGAYPYASLINVNGILYGTTINGGGTGCGDGGGCGTVFSVHPATGKEKVHFFGDGTRGAYPSASLININGTLYGTASLGGAHDDGTVFSFTPRGNGFKVLHSFGPSGFDGQMPSGSLINVNGTLYGTTQTGGNGVGTVFSITTGGTEKVLYSFTTSMDGEYPSTSLINVKGTLYGTTGGGGANGGGTVFSVDPTTGTENVLHSFGPYGTDGIYPSSSLINVNGLLYGTTYEGGGTGCGGYGCGTVFSFAP